LQKRLKATVKGEQRDFNQTRFEQENPYYMSTTNREPDDPRPQHLELNREKILAVRLTIMK